MSSRGLHWAGFCVMRDPGSLEDEASCSSDEMGLRQQLDALPKNLASSPQNFQNDGLFVN